MTMPVHAPHRSTNAALRYGDEAWVQYFQEVRQEAWPNIEHAEAEVHARKQRAEEDKRIRLEREETATRLRKTLRTKADARQRGKR